MSKLVKKVNWNMPNQKPSQMYMYGEASFEANQQMQEPLEKLYQYENQSDMREKVKEYINELDTEIKRCEEELQKYYKNNEDVGVIHIQSRINTLIDAKNDLESILDEVI